MASGAAAATAATNDPWLITTVAGNGTPGFSGDGKPATQAQLDSAEAAELDANGNMYILDHSNARIRKVNAQGIISTFREVPQLSSGLVVANGFVYYTAGYFEPKIYKVATAGRQREPRSMGRST